jgi:hypothetical protein
MCDPVSAAIATAVGTAASLAGTAMGAQAQQKQAQAIASANQQTQLAQNQGFTQRMQAGVAQTAAQTAASQETIQARNQAAMSMRDAQMKSLQDYHDTINAQNAQAERLRATGDVAAQDLLTQTNPQSLDQAQAQRQDQAAALLKENLPPSPDATSPDAVGGDPVNQGALARRTAEAATNIRDYGSRIARAGSYAAPSNAINLAIADAKYGIMPAQQAEELLKSGSATRLLPSKVGYQAATGEGQAQDLLLQSRGQNALDAAGLSYGNATSLANLQQANADQITKNKLAQTSANLEAQASQGKVIQGVGQLGLYGAGQYYGGGSPLSGIFGTGGTFGSQGPIFGNSQDAALRTGGNAVLLPT